jgi:two-component system, chemotaxis family, sensor histidine kinase and response regulator WspE
MVSDPNADLSMLDLFHAELETHSLAIEKGLLGDGACRDPKLVESLMRAAHSLRGAARIVGLAHAATLAGAMEKVLDAGPIAAGVLERLREANALWRELAKCVSAEIPNALDIRVGDIERLSNQLTSSGAGPEPPRSEPAAPAPVDPFLLDLFHAELEAHSRVLETGLVETEACQDPKKIEPLMRAAHSLKGASRIIGLDSAVQLAHAMEDLLSAAQKGKRQLVEADFDLLLRANDVFSELAACEPLRIPGALADQTARVQELVRQFADPSCPAPVPAPAPEPAPVEPTPKAATGKVEEASVRVSVENLNRLTGFAGECLVEVKTLRPLTQTVQRIKQHHTVLSNAVEQAMEALRKERTAEAMARLEETLQQTAWIHRTIPGHLAEFERFSRKLEHLANRLYDEAVASRMRPFSDGLHGFPRMVRDMAKSLGKSARFEIEGESTRVDRDILEKLEAPLTHLLRNAVDHGLEGPEARAAAGKPPEGTVTLTARHVSGVLEIAVEDNGGGIDVERVRRQVAARGYATSEMAESLSESEVLDFLFLPGFSTKPGVTEISGRGVGLDVVQSMVRQVGGSVRVESWLGKGTRFVLQLPLTLSVIRTLMFEVQSQPYALPLTRVDRVMSVSPADILVVEGRQFCRVADQNIGLVEAAQVLDLPVAGRPAGDLRVVVLSDRLNRHGLVVDRLIGEHDLVVMPLPVRLGKVPNVSAGAILENGSPIAILDSEDLVRSIDNLLTRGKLLKLDKGGKAEKSRRRRVLVVDDSLTVREVERRLLENRGYDVTVAVDGMDGWNAVQNSHFDLVLTDIDMPRMDGIELVKRIKGAPHTASIPVMIVSYKDQEEYRLKGIEAGAACYLTKSSFHDETLADTVRDLIEEAES